MKTAHKKQGQHKQAVRQAWACNNNPVAQLFSKAKANDDFMSQVLDTRIKLYSATAGDDATELLASLAVVIGTPCEAGARLFGRAPWVVQLHGALRTIQQMCLQGYTWQPIFAPALNAAIDQAVAERNGIDPGTFMDALIEANALAKQVLNHTVQPDSIAGAAQP